MINNMPNSTHPTLTPFIIFKGTKIDLNVQKLVPLGSYARATLCQKELTTSINLITIMASYYILVMIQHLI